MPVRRPALLALALCVASATGLAACGDDDSGGDTAQVEGAAAPGDAGASEGTDGEGDAPAGDPGSGDLIESIGGEEARDAIDSLDFETKVGALESAMGDDVERVEIDGDTVHIYLAEDGTFDAMMGCMVTGSILSDTEQAVFHQGGESTPCE